MNPTVCSICHIPLRSGYPIFICRPSNFRVAAGHTYCAIGALTFLDRLSKSHKPIALLSPKAVPFDSLVRWLVARQTSELGDDEEESDDEDGHSVGGVRSLSATVEEPSIDTKVDQLPVVPPETEGSLRWAGFNGRCNKYADTCYSFWNTASLNVSDLTSTNSKCAPG